MLCNVSQSSNCSAHSSRGTSATRVLQAEGWTTVSPSVPLALVRVSQITLLSYPCNLPNQHILQTLGNHPKSYTDLTQTSYTDPLELHCLRETALGTLPTNYWSLSFCFEENCLWNAQCRAREWSFTRDLVQALEKESILHKTQILV